MTDQAPERIYLQDAGDYAATVKFEVTWCVEPVDDADTQYIRLDLHEAEVAKLRDERDEAMERETIAADAAVGYLERAEKAEAEVARLQATFADANTKATISGV